MFMLCLHILSGMTLPSKQRYATQDKFDDCVTPHFLEEGQEECSLIMKTVMVIGIPKQVVRISSAWEFPFHLRTCVI